MPTRHHHSLDQQCSAVIDAQSQTSHSQSLSASTTESAHTNPARQETESIPGAAQREPASLPAGQSPFTALATAPGPESEAQFDRAAKRNRRRKRVRMGAALRNRGIDEYMVADTFGDVVDMLKTKTEATDSVEKLLVDVLKECSKHLEEDSKLDSGPYVRINLIHHVARPTRNTTPAASSAPPSASPSQPSTSAASPLPQPLTEPVPSPLPPASSPCSPSSTQTPVPPAERGAPDTHFVWNRSRYDIRPRL